MTSEIAFNDHLLTRMKYRRDWSIVSVFPHTAVAFVGSQGTASGGFQNTATLGLLWWFGGQQVSW